MDINQTTITTTRSVIFATFAKEPQIHFGLLKVTINDSQLFAKTKADWESNRRNNPQLTRKRKRKIKDV